MKTIVTAFVSLISLISVHAQTTYTVSGNTNWNSAYPGYCNTCTFNIASGVTVTLNTNATCYNCSINGGTLTMTSDFTFQQSTLKNTTVNLAGHTLNLQNNGTTFTNTIVNAKSKSVFLPTGTISISGSTFNFSDTSEFYNNGGTLNISSSNFYFYGNSFFNATAGPVNLSAGTQMIAGDGTTSSKAYILLNGPALNLVDAASALYAANVNNYYANWSAYSSLSNSKTYTTSGLNKNCGGSGQNACSSQLYYGCASFSSSGPAPCTPLATSITDLKASQQGSEIRLNWSAANISDNSLFQVERSTNGGLFSPLNTQEASSLINSFSFTDPLPASGNNDYRIVLTNADGKISYSHIISIQVVTGAESAISIYPNPVTDGHFFLQMPTNASLQLTIYNMQGQILCTRSMGGQTKYTVQLPPNIGRELFIVRVAVGNKIETFNLLNIR